MARSIGSIEVVVEADTRRLKAQMTKGGAEAGKAAAQAIEEELDDITADVGVDVDSADLRATEVQIEQALDDLLAEVGVRVNEADLEQVDATIHETIDDLLAEVGITVDEGDLERVDATIHESIDDLLATVGISVSEEDIAAVRAEAEMSLDDLLATVGITVSEGDIAAVRAEVTGSLDDLLVTVGVTADMVEAERVRAQLEAEFLTELDAVIGVDLRADQAMLDAQISRRLIEEEYQGISALVSVSPSMADVAVTAAIINEGVSNIEAEVDVDYDKASKARTDAAIEENFRQLGGKSGKGFGGSLLSGDNTKLIIAAFVSMGDAAAQALSGGVAAATSVLSSGIAAVGAAAGAAAPLVVSFGAAIGAIVVGSKGFGGAMKAVTKEYEAAATEGRAVDLATGEVGIALSKLAPAARFAATAFGHLKDDLHNVQVDVQQKLFEGFAAEIADLGQTVLPDVSKALQISADSVNEFGKQLADVARNTDFEQMAKDLKPALDNAFDAGTAMAETLEPFLKAAAPAAERLAGMIERVAEGLRDWVKANPDEIGTFLDEGLDSLEKWADLVADVGDLLGTVFAAGRTQGDTFIDSLDRMIQRWDDFAESVAGQQALADFFESGRKTIEAMKPVLEGLKDAFGTLIGPETPAAFADLADALGKALPAFGDILAISSKLNLANIFLDIIGAIEPLLDLLLRLPDAVFEVAGTAIVLVKLSSAFGTVAESAAKAAGSILTFARGNPEITAVLVAVGLAVVAWEQLKGGSEKLERQLESQNNAMQNATDAMIKAQDAASGAKASIEGMNDALEAGIEGVDTKGLQTAFGEINKAAGRTVITSKDMAQTLIDFDKDPVAAMTKLAEGMHLPADAARELAEMVNQTNTNFESISSGPSKFVSQFTNMAEVTGLTTDQLVAMARQMEFIQDQADQSDLRAFAEQQLGFARGAEGAEQSMLREAEAIAISSGHAGDALVIYSEFIRLKYEAASASEQTRQTELLYGDALSHVDQAIGEANAAADERAAALKKVHDEAFKAWQEEQNLAEETKLQAIAAADAKGFSADLATEIVNLGESAHKAADQASALMDAINLLIAPAATVESGMSDLEQAIDDFSLAITGGQEAADARAEAWNKEAESVKLFAEANKLASEGAGENAKKAARLNAEADILAAKGQTDAANLKREAAREAMQADADGAEAKREAAEEAHNASVAAAEEAKALEAAAHSMDISTEAGRNNREALRDQAATALELAGAMVTTGAGTDEVTAKLAATRAELEKQAEAYGLPTSEAQNYINTLLGTPELINTIIATPGMFDALLNAKDLTLLYDAAGNPVITEFEALGLDPAIANTEGFKTLLEQLNLIHANPTVTATTAAPTAEELGAVQDQVETLDSSNADPTLALPEGATVEEQLANLQTAVNNLDESVAKPEITLVNNILVSGQINSLQTNLNTLDATVASPTVLIFGIQSQIDKVVELQRNLDLLKNKTITVTVNQVGGVPEVPGGMAGELITHPTIRRVGERGLAEAIVPLQLPLNRVDPSVRHLAELLRGGTAGIPGSGIKRQVNNYMTITPASADPAAVATQVINRAAALATR